MTARPRLSGGDSSCYLPAVGSFEFRILGPLEVRDGDRPVHLGGPRQRALLALLLTRAGEVVSRDWLIDELWGAQQPESVVNVLQTYISHLRKALPSGALVTRAQGYGLDVEPDQLDLRRFERLVDAGREALAAGDVRGAADALREALALWRGPALADVAYEPFAQAEIARLEELRLAALELRNDTYVALGRHAELVGELEALVARHPLRERLRGQLMLALYRSGRQVEALATYREARQILVDELGIEPGEPLRELERAILRHDPALEPASAPRAGRGAALSERAILVAPRDERSLDVLLALAEILARRPGRELILARVLVDGRELGEETRRLHRRREALAARGLEVRAAAFTSPDPPRDVVRLAAEQAVDLLLVDAGDELLGEEAPAGDVGTVFAGAPCDVAVLVERAGRLVSPGPDRRVLVPFGGGTHEWAALAIGAWIAGAAEAPLVLVGTAADSERGGRDASRLLASASLLLQQVTRVAAEPLLVAAGPDGVAEASIGAGLVLLGLPDDWRARGLGSTRLEVLRRVDAACVLVRGGLRPGGLSPRESATRFTWTLAGAATADALPLEREV